MRRDIDSLLKHLEYQNSFINSGERFAPDFRDRHYICPVINDPSVVHHAEINALLPEHFLQLANLLRNNIFVKSIILDLCNDDSDSRQALLQAILFSRLFQ